MTEGGTIRMKRNGARMFKNPPQPHMCIQVFIQGTTAPCYVNVLSWDKIEMPCRPSQPIPLYGGMRLPPPRTKTEAVVFAVMANPEILRVNGKNAKDPKKRSSLIELLLEFVEAMNAGIVFTREYTILKDRDITGELKEVWNAVQAKRDKEQPPIQQETWIDAQPPPVPQYSQYQDPQQQDYTAQPPQYHSSVAYGRPMGNDGIHYDNYSHPQQNSILSQNEQMYHQPGQVVPQQYHTNVRIAQDRYNYRERGRENPVQNIPQQSCPAYPTPQYQFQQLPRQMVPQYVNSNMHHNANLNYNSPTNSSVNPAMNTNLTPPFQLYMPYRQRVDNSAMHVDMRRMQQQQQQQMHMNHVQPVPQYEPNVQFNPPNTWMNVFRLNKPHMGVTQKNNVSKRQINSPTHSKQNSCTNCQTKETPEVETKPKSPVKVLQREIPSSNRQDGGRTQEDSVKTYADKSSVEESNNVQVTDLDEDLKKNDSTLELSTESSKLQNNEQTSEPGAEVAPNTTSPVEFVDEKLPQDPKDFNSTNSKQIVADQKATKTKIIVIKGNKYKDNNKTSGGQTQDNRTIRIRYINDQKTNDSPKRSQTTVNSIIKSVFKINPGISSEEPSGKKKTNGQSKGGMKSACENEDAQPGYTILKKADCSNAQEDVVSDIAQLSIQDCKETNELSAVLS